MQQTVTNYSEGSVCHARNWYALRVKVNREKLAADGLEQKGYAHLLPLYQSRRRWSDRIKVSERPLFPGYVFCCFGYQERQRVLQSPAVHSIVTFGTNPTPVPDDEILSLTRLIDSSMEMEPVPYMQAGQLVRICKGPLSGVTGFLREIKNSHRLVISIDLLQRSVATEIDADAAVPIDSRPRQILSWHRSPWQQDIDLTQIRESEI